MIGEIGGELLFTKITRPHRALMVNFSPGLFKTIDKGSLIVCDNNLLEELQLTITRVVEDGSFHRCDIVLIIDEDTLNSEALLKNLNMRMRSLWASMSVLIKPWNGGLPRCKDGHFFTTAVGDIAARIDQALKRLPALFKNPVVKLLCMHRSGRTIHNGPKAPLAPTMSLMISTEECTYVRAVSESPTAQGAVAPWSLTTTPPKKVKRLNNKLAKQGWLQREEVRGWGFPWRTWRLWTRWTPWRSRRTWRLQRTQLRADDCTEWDTLPHLVVYTLTRPPCFFF